jgi:hypothetical protein
VSITRYCVKICEIERAFLAWTSLKMPPIRSSQKFKILIG